jgi:hypothetical protein
MGRGRPRAARGGHRRELLAERWMRQGSKDASAPADRPHERARRAPLRLAADTEAGRAAPRAFGAGLRVHDQARLAASPGRDMRRIFQRTIAGCQLAHRGLTPHSLRDTFATRHLNTDWGKLPWVSRQLGHESEGPPPSTTSRSSRPRRRGTMSTRSPAAVASGRSGNSRTPAGRKSIGVDGRR